MAVLEGGVAYLYVTHTTVVEDERTSIMWAREVAPALRNCGDAICDGEWSVGE